LRAVFLFPPKASPTYAPLGLASLVAHVRERAPGCSLAVRDLNLESWTWLAGEEPRGPDLLRFMCEGQGGFYDETAYGLHRDTWRRIATRISGLSGEACRYTDTGEASRALLGLLDRMRGSALRTDPELVGISVMFLDQVPFALALARHIREGRSAGPGPSGAGGRQGGPRVVLGGAALSALRTDELLAHCPWVDGAVLGEGEAAAALLAGGAPWHVVPGLAYREEPGRVRRNRKADTLSLRELPPPDFSLFELPRYLNPTPVLPVLFSRGCRWRRCRFCSHNASFCGYRAKSIAGFTDELVRLREDHGAAHVYLADQYVDAEDLGRIADEILKRGRTPMPFHVMGRPTAGYTPRLLEKAARAGCRWICWGVESGSQRLLDLSRKGTERAEVERVVRDAARAGISNLLMMIFGLPTSSELDLWQTLRFLEDVHDAVDAVSASSFVLWEGTPFARNPSAYGLRRIGAEEILRVNGAPLRTRRLVHMDVSPDGSLRPPGGPQEVIAWEKRRRWLGAPSFLERLPCEHYLLFAARRWETGAHPGSPHWRAA